MALRGKSSGQELHHLFVYSKKLSGYKIPQQKGALFFSGSDDYLTFNKNLKFVVLYFVIL